ncbi:cytochrome P450 [Meredithblackwellia eburnea MCA 4105]
MDQLQDRIKLLLVQHQDKLPFDVRRSWSSKELYVVGVGVGLILWLVTRFLQAVTHPLRNVPGPLIAKITPYYLSFKAITGNRSIYIESLHKKYGRTVRVGPNEISTIDTEAVATIFAQGTHFKKDEGFYDRFQIDQGAPGILNMADKVQHARRRRLMSSAFAKSNIVRLEEFVRGKAVVLAEHFRKDTVEGNVTNFLQDFRLFTADVVCHATFGNDLKMIDSRELHPFVAAVDQSLTISAAEIASPLIYNIVKAFYVQFASEENKLRLAFESQQRALHGFGEPWVNEYQKNFSYDPDNKEILSRLLGGMAAKEHPITLRDVLADCVNTLTAGTDTTSTTLTYLAYRVFTTPHIQKALHAELVAAIPDPTELPTYSDLEKLPLLRSCIQETLRLHSAAPSTLPRVVPKGGLMASGHYIAPGCIVGVQTYSTHRDQLVWGDDVEEWKPERWDRLTDVQKSTFRPFSSGPAACLGINMAYLELYVVSAKLFRSFNGQFAPGFGHTQMAHMDFFLASPVSHACKFVLSPA